MFLKKYDKWTTHDYLKIKFQYDDAIIPTIIHNPFKKSPIPEIRNAYRLNLSSFELFLVNAYNIIPKRQINAKNMKKPKNIQLFGISSRKAMYKLYDIRTRTPPDKPIIDIKRIILLFRVCFFSICFNNLFRFINFFGRLSVIGTY